MRCSVLVILFVINALTAFSQKHISFNGTITMHAVINEKPQIDTSISLHFYNGLLCIDSIRSEKNYVRLLIDCDSQYLYFLQYDSLEPSIKGTFAEFKKIIEQYAGPQHKDEDSDLSASFFKESETKEINGYTTYRAILRKSTIRHNEDYLLAELWMTNEAGIVIDDLKPLLDMIFSLPQAKAITSHFNQVPLYIRKAFPLEIKAYKDPGPLAATFHFYIHKNNVDTKKFDISGFTVISFQMVQKSNKFK